MSTPTSAPRSRRRAATTPLRTGGHVLGGGLIGAAEVVPGVSGGTVALVIGFYDRLLGSGDHVVQALASLRPGRSADEAREHLRQVPWGFLVPLLAGMAVALVVGARVLEPLVEEEPERTRAAFFGLVAASVVVPLQMVGWLRSARDLLYLLPAVVVAYALVSIPPAEVSDPLLPLVGLAAAVAVCALVLPGVSGSFFLLSVGLYEPTLAAVNDRDLLYLAVFGLGALLGLATVVRGVRTLLEKRRRPTLLVMTGLMIGSLRALWPWQDEDRDLLGPSGGTGEVLVVVLIAAVAAAVVLALVAADAVARRRADTPVAPTR